MRFVYALIAASLLVSCSSTPDAPPPPPADEFLHLEEIQGQQPLAWVKERNSETEAQIEKLPNFKSNEKVSKEIILAKDRLPNISQRGSYVYNFWQDDVNVRGLWRRTSITEFKKRSPRWEVVINFDELAKKEKENWVFKGSNCLPPKYENCLITLSRGGKDAAVVREFNTKSKSFVKDGFQLSEAKSRTAWVDENTLLIATDFGPGSLTTSGYPRIVKIWKRGIPLNAAITKLEAKPEDVSVWVYTIHTPKGAKVLAGRSPSFFEDEVFELNSEGVFKKIEKQNDAQYTAWLNGQHILTLRSDWTVRGEVFKAGSLVALPLLESAQPKLIFAPNDKQSITTVEQSKDALIINYMDTVQSKVARAYLKGDAWAVEDLPFPEKGDIVLSSVDAFGDSIIATFESFLIPDSIMLASASLDRKAEEIKPITLKSLPPRFDSSKFQVEQLWATSRDGTQVPYFLLTSKDMKKDGSTPTLIYGYGGFEQSQGPYYPALTGKLWLEKGGAYVIANIRGGGEFGPAWHQAALKEKRQVAFDDFISVAEDLIKRQISSPNKMAISGGSNGGLLVGATFVQRPDLFKAVLCKVPLLDMVRYNKLLAGASWEGEYGKPEDPKVLPAILKYSPYQNVKAGVKYPEVFFITSTLDDRVHPGHARKMVARMKAQGHPVLYFENTEGGHSAAANLLQRVKFSTLEFTFLQDRLLKN